jgi:HPt (histidine-containing phosphotransfer) domain-containing protein
MEGESMIDSTALLNLITVQDSESFLLVKDLENIFIKQTPKLIQNMYKGIEAEDSDLIKRAAHTLKTSCCYLGLVDMVELCHQIQMSAEKGQSGHFEVSLLVQKLERAYFDGLNDLKSLVAEIGQHIPASQQMTTPLHRSSHI